MSSGCDLSEAGDWDTLLSQMSNTNLRDEVRHYCRVIYYVQHLRKMKWALFALFITLCIEFQIRAVFPNDFQTQAFFALIVAVCVMALVWLVEHGVLLYGGNPTLLRRRCTSDEENALVHGLEGKVVQKLPRELREQVGNIGALFTMQESSVSPTATTTTTTTTHSASNGVPANKTVPIASIETRSPRSPILFPPLGASLHRPQQQPYHGVSSSRSTSTDPPKVRANLVGFYAALTRSHEQ
jgi:hypothetical protein